jgi:segregation and condensation protein B
MNSQGGDESMMDHPETEDLGRSYGALLDQQPWEEDVSVVAEDRSLKAEQNGSVAPPLVERIIEALLFIGGAPLTATRACETIRELTPAQFMESIDTLNRAYRKQGRPYAIQTQGQGYTVSLRPRFRPVLEKLYGTVREARLSPAAVDVLALVAYRQPATKLELDSLRGMDCGSLLRQLVRRGLVAVLQRGQSNQRDVTYGTTPRFLELFHLRSLDDLPQTQDLQKM